MIDWMPEGLKRVLASLWQSSAAASPRSKLEEPFIANGRLVYGSDPYNEVVEEQRKRRLAEDAEVVRKQRDLPNLG